MGNNQTPSLRSSNETDKRKQGVDVLEILVKGRVTGVAVAELMRPKISLKVLIIRTLR
jgi:hypothetical protein